MAYKLLSSDTPKDLNKQVNEMLAKGWELYGYPIVKNTVWGAPDGTDCLIREYCQAVIGEDRFDDEDIPFS